jgi:beta-glucuronidase
MTLRILLLLATTLMMSARSSMDLSGSWRFTPDYQGRGEQAGWFKPDLDEGGWDTVDVPHIWDLDPRYLHTGAAWYRRKFVAPAVAGDEHARIRFDAVFYKCRVWLNGTLIGEHEGGYTGFQFDAGAALKPGAENVITVMADNSWGVDTIPGARRGDRPNDQSYPWWNYGGIKKPVHLEVLPAVHVLNQKVMAVPDLAAKTAAVTVRVWVRNTSSAARRVALRWRVRRPGAWDPSGTAEAMLNVPAQGVAVGELKMELAAPVALWDLDHPNLYESQVQAAGDRATSRFGVRKVEARDARLWLNGEPVSLGGANRVADHPKFGSMENRTVIGQDFSIMKRGNMGLSRIGHYPPAQTLLDWCDEHGFLIIAEAGGWQLKPDDLDSEVLRAVWRSQAKEMVEQSWNHPSVIGWSVGNEYQSDTPAGVRWTRDMIAFTRTLDDTRLMTFASLGGKALSPVKPEENSFHYVDILCPNIYGNGGLPRVLEALHTTWPSKPVLITEYGWRADTVPSEEARAKLFREAMGIVRRYPFVIGASIWTFNDYRSRYPGTNADGFRRWGIVSDDRRLSLSYAAIREEYSPVVMTDVSLERTAQSFSVSYALKLRLAGRTDFPSRTVRDHDINVILLDRQGQERKVLVQSVPLVRPGDDLRISIPLHQDDVSNASSIRVEWRQPTGFVSLETTLPTRE